MKQGWEIKKLGEVCKFSQGIQVPIEEQYTTCEEGMIRFLRIIDFTQNGEAPRYINNVDDRYILHDKEIAIVRYGTPGFVCYGKTGAIANNLFKISQKKEIFDFSFLKYWLSSDAFQGVVKGNKYGAALQAIKFSTINEIPIPVPPLPEQEKIVSELDCLSGIIEKKRQQLKELDALAQSIFYEMFGNPVDNERGWEVKKLGEIAASQIGLTYKPENVTDSNEGTIVLRSSNIQNSMLAFEDIVRVDCEVKENKYVQDGDILMCSRNGSAKLVGKVARIKNLQERMSYGAFMTIIRSDYNDYLFEFFKLPAFRSQLISSQTATINQITVKMLADINVPLPPLPLQQSFAQKIEAIEQQKALIKQSIAEVETLFNARMQEYFE